MQETSVCDYALTDYDMNYEHAPESSVCNEGDILKIEFCKVMLLKCSCKCSLTGYDSKFDRSPEDDAIPQIYGIFYTILQDYIDILLIHVDHTLTN